MLKHLHKFLLVCVLLCSFGSTCVFAQNEKPIEVVNEVTSTTTTINVKDIDIEPLNTQTVKKEVMPDVKKETKKFTRYLITVIFTLIFCIIGVYLAIFFKKYYQKTFSNELEEFSDKLELTVPSNKEEALKSFLNRTK